VRITSVEPNNHKHAFLVTTATGVFSFPFAKAEPAPGPADRVVSLAVDEETGGETFSYRLATGKEGCVHMGQVLEYHQDPSYMRDLLLYKLTIEAERRMNDSKLSKREIIRRLGTSPAQLYRLLDTTNYRKSVDQMLALLHVLDCEVDLVVRAG
jgi:hypothetical protein